MTTRPETKSTSKPTSKSTMSACASALIALVASAGLPAIGIATLASSSTIATAQNTNSDDAESRRAKRETLIALSKPITLDVTEQPLEDLFNFITDVTGAEMEPIFLTDSIAANGMDPATPITIKVTNTPALVVLDRILLPSPAS